MSNILKDRTFVRENLQNIFESKELSKKIMKTRLEEGKFTYIDAFVKYTHNNNDSVRRKIGTLSTLSILYYLNESFKKIDKKFIKSVNKIKLELSSRSDLFESVIEYYGNLDVTDETQYWHPDLQYCDILSLVLDLIPDLLNKYKEYLVKKYILNIEFKTGLFGVLTQRVHKNLFHFDIIRKDMVLFNLNHKTNNYDVSQYIDKEKDRKRKRLQKENWVDIKTNYKIVTGIYWVNEDLEYCECEQVLNIIGIDKKQKEYNSDISLSLVSSLSYVDISIGKHRLTVDLGRLEDLISRNDRSLSFWIDRGIIDENWNEI